MRRQRAEPSGIAHSISRRRSLSDPLAAALRPPENETHAEREKRLEAEEKAKQVSDGIDEMIRAEKKERRVKQEVKVLLLGQSESGKSTTLKPFSMFIDPAMTEFQLMHSPAAFRADRMAWRAVIYLNLVRSVRRILDAITPDIVEADEQDDDTATLDAASINITSSGRPGSSMSSARVPKFDIHRKRLEPLLALEERLIRMLSSPDEDEATHLGPVPQGWSPPEAWTSSQAGPSGTSNGIGTNVTVASEFTITSPVSPSSAPPPYVPHGSSSSKHKKQPEMALHHTTNWKKAFALGGKSKNPKNDQTNEIAGWWDDPDDPVHILNACAPSMQDLWRDKTVRARLNDKKLRLEESSGFYLNEISRITAKRYIPTDDDVLKARLKTLGVVEHKFTLQGAGTKGIDWKIFDVGGATNQRQAWAPYFEDANAIIFLAPISAFDQVLAEDTKVNRLEDSLLLWKSVVSNKLLADVNIVLFLNKCDLLQSKLNAGVRLKDHMTSYGDRPNDYQAVSEFRDIIIKHNLKNLALV
ncbi:hypothetical protein HWV62_1829 [Athelia sp. TMB]|nr:hypothetical protein HWV62_1829 [Athelia sp. TMB]